MYCVSHAYEYFGQVWTAAEQKNKNHSALKIQPILPYLFQSRSKITRQEERSCKEPGAIEMQCDA